MRRRLAPELMSGLLRVSSILHESSLRVDLLLREVAENTPKGAGAELHQAQTCEDRVSIYKNVKMPGTFLPCHI